MENLLSKDLLKEIRQSLRREFWRYGSAFVTKELDVPNEDSTDAFKDFPIYDGEIEAHLSTGERYTMVYKTVGKLKVGIWLSGLNLKATKQLIEELRNWKGMEELHENLAKKTKISELDAKFIKRKLEKAFEKVGLTETMYTLKVPNSPNDFYDVDCRVSGAWLTLHTYRKATDDELLRIAEDVKHYKDLLSYNACPAVYINAELRNGSSKMTQKELKQFYKN